MAITTFVGQNYGAQNYKRVRKGLYTTLLMCEIIIALGAFLIYTNGEFLVGLFSQDKDVIVAGVTMISVFAPGYIIPYYCRCFKRCWFIENTNVFNDFMFRYFKTSLFICGNTI